MKQKILQLTFYPGGKVAEKYRYWDGTSTGKNWMLKGEENTKEKNGARTVPKKRDNLKKTT